ncbi:unnamed protein product [Cochlearia groenlandica]
MISRPLRNSGKPVTSHISTHKAVNNYTGRKALVFEDAPSYVMAAKKAGITKFDCDVADQVLANMLALKPKSFMVTVVYWFALILL